MSSTVNRECGTCTKCCEGWLTGEALGYKFYPGNPCHFVSIGQSCTVYTKRPKNPCVSFSCEWIKNSDLPEWFKPNKINSILTTEKIEEILYLKLTQAGSQLDSKVLSWLFKYVLEHNFNFVWQIAGGINWIGSPEFTEAFSKTQNI